MGRQGENTNIVGFAHITIFLGSWENIEASW